MADRHVKNLITHVFQTRKVEIIEDEISNYELLDLFYDSLVELSTEFPIAFSLLNDSRSIYRSHFDQQTLTEAFKKRKSLIIYLQEQNSLFIAKPKGKAYQIDLYPSPLSNEDIVFNNYRCELPEASYLIETTKITDCFIEQLIAMQHTLFNDALPRATKKREIFSDLHKPPSNFYVKDWFLPALNLNINIDVISIKKKINEEIISFSKEKKWRRNPFYTSIKFVLHHQIVQEMGEIGHFYYKLAIILVQHKILSSKVVTLPELSDSGLLYEIHCKISNRIQKLKQGDIPSPCTQILKKIEDDLIKRIKDDKIRHAEKIGQYENYQKISKTPKVKIKGVIDLTQSLSNTTLTYLLQKKIKPPEFTYRAESRSYLPLFQFKDDPTDKYQNKSYLYHLEIIIRNMWPQRISNRKSIEEVWEIYQKYDKLGSEIYQEDKVSKGIQQLTLTTLVALIDIAIVNEYPFLKNYKNHVDLSVLRTILLPLQSQMKLLAELEQYFEERNEAPKQGPLVHCEDSVATKFYQDCNRMKVLKKRILRKDKQNIQEKENEKQRAIKERNDLRIKERSYVCNYEKISGRIQHIYWNCKKCDIQNEISSMKIIKYESLLPDREWEQNTVVFELLMPQRISIWRDALFKLLLKLELVTESDPSNNKLYDWKSDDRLRLFASTRDTKVSLQSTTASFRAYHYGITLDSHDSLVVPNGFNLNLTSNGKLIEIRETPNTITKMASNFTYKITDKLFSKLSEYCSLPGNENVVIASLSECPKEVTISNWHSFGTLRAGASLQYHNLLAFFHSEKLPFERSGSSFLLMNAIWQVWTNDEKNSYLRDAHDIINSNDIFTSEFVDELLKYLERIKDQWEKPFCLISISLAAIRCFTLVKDSSLPLIYNLLKKIRDIGMEWFIRINKVLDDVMSDENAKEKDKDNLRRKICYVSFAILLTYFTDEDRVSKLLFQEDDFRHWVRALVQLNRNYSPSESRENLTSFYYLVQRIGFILYPTISQNIAQYLSGFLAERDLSLEEFGNWKEIENTGIFKCEKKNHNDSDFKSTVELNCLDGLLLINGFPNGRLPSHFVNDELFQRLFGKSTVFDVIRNGNIFTTSKHYSGSFFQFFITTDSKIMIVDKSKDKSRELRLIPHNLLQNDLPIFFVQNFSHWLDYQEEIIYFRPPSFKHPDFFDIPESKFIMETYRKGKWRLKENFPIEIGTQRTLLNYNGTQMERICESVITSIEIKENLHVWATVINNITQRVLEIELPRYDLFFTLSDEILRCNQWVVCEDQKIGTLFGLLNYIKLQSDEDSNSHELIVPHGEINMTKRDNNKFVEIGQHLSPSYFTFSVKKNLRRIEAPQSQEAWLYLANLHAVTSLIYRDPFTKMTGTEQAIHILNLKICKSFNPYSDLARERLKKISNLSPKRSFIPPHLRQAEVIEWPNHLPSLNASDAFVILATKLLSDCSILKTTIIQPHLSHIKKETEKESDGESEGMLFLNNRAYWKSKNFFSSVAHLSNEFIEFPITSIRTRSSRSQTDFHVVDQVANSIFKEIPIEYSGISLRDWLSGSKPIFLGAHLESCSDWTGITSKIKQYYFSILQLIENNRNNKSFLSLFISFISYQLREKIQDAMIAIVSFVNFAIKPDSTNLIDFLQKYPFQFPSFQPKTLTASSLIRNHSIRVTSSDCERLIGIGVLPSGSTTYDLNKLVLQESNKITGELENRISFIENIISREQYMQKPPWDTSLKISSLSQSSNSKYIIYASEIDNEIAKYLIDLSQWRVLEKVSKKFEYLLQFNGSIRRPSKLINQGIVEIKFPSNIRDYYSRGDSKEAIEIAMEIIENKHPKLPWIVTLRNSDSKNDHREFLDKLDSLRNFESQPVSEHFINNLKESWDCPPPVSEMNIKEDFINEFRKQSEEFEKFCTSKLRSLKKLLRQVLNPPEFQLLEECNLLLPYSVQIIIPQLLDNEDKEITNIVGAITQLKVFRQKTRRMKNLILKNKSKFNKELISQEDSQIWNIQDYPSWLIFEFENDLSIRPLQAKVAFKMLNPQSNQHSLLQLNMGEGKTAVITPIVAAHLAHSKKSLVRVIVLPSLYETNYSTLRYQLGRFLNHYIFTVPCARDHVIDSTMLSNIYDSMEFAKKNGGIIVTVPEYLKSFELKYFEACVNHTKESENTQLLAKCLNFEVNNAKDIIDEADAILHFKSQLIYTLGDQNVVDGDCDRWETITELIKIVTDICRNKHEFDNQVQVDRNMNSFEFPNIRFLSKPTHEFVDWFKGEILSEFIKSFNLPGDKIKILKMYIKNPKLSLNLIQKLNDLKLDQKQIKILHTTRGFIAFEIFVLCFSRRWRVEYGVNQKQSRLMAVPFRGKDVAADRTEFGHPDVAIAHTILAYYHSGLSDDQLSLCFEKLDHLEVTEQTRIISDWRLAISEEEIKKKIPPLLKNINLSDVNQKKKIFNILKTHIQVINFFLFRVVFPKEAKQFPSKITRNSWSHVDELRINPVTGFSGTNDTSLLLPLNIIQNDLDELKGTNAHVLKCILNNQSYSKLSRDICANELISKLKEGKKPNVLLDVGALMIESNEEVAKQWLLSREDAKGVVYFCSKKNELVVLSRSGKVKPLYHYNTQNELTKDFLVYLDEIHTRGTDLVLPDGTLAVVTLGARVTKDKFVQGCMRMRKLGKEHSLAFWASDEVNLEIESLLQSKEEVTSSHIILWVLRNSIRAIVEGFTLWGSQAINHMHIRNLIKEVGDVFPEDLNNIIKFGKECKSKDALSLKEMYGGVRGEQTVPELIQDWGLHTTNKKQISELDKEYVSKIYAKCTKYVSDIKTFAQLLSEEQERELEAETEEEILTQRPPLGTAAAPSNSPLISDYFISCNPNLSSLEKIVFPLSHNFRDSIILTEKLRQVYRHDQRLFCSSEFCTVIDLEKQPDSALRLPSWCMITRKKDRSGIDAIILLAPHEANELMKLSRKSSLVSLHRFISRSIPQQSLLIENSSIAIPFIPFSEVEEEDLKRLSIQLSLFAGSLYFKEIINPNQDIFEEQKLTAAYLGICPRNYTTAEELAFQKEEILPNGFIPPEHRHFCYNNLLIPDSYYNNNIIGDNNSNNPSFSFQEEPHEFVAGLYNIRGSANNYSLSDVGRLLTLVKFLPCYPKKLNEKYLTVIRAKKENTIVDKKGFGEKILKEACDNCNPPFPFEVLVRDLKSRTKLNDKLIVLRQLAFFSFDLLLDISDFLESL